MKLHKEILKFIDKQKFCNLATSTKSGKPEAAIMTSVVMDGKILLATSKSTRKYKNLKTNKKVSLTYANSIYSKGAQIDGTAKVLEETPELKSYYLKKRPFARPYFKMYPNRIYILITPTWARYFKRFGAKIIESK